jgi:hypothetical protein
VPFTVVVVVTGRVVVDVLVDDRGADVFVGGAAVLLLPHAARHSIATEKNASRVTAADRRAVFRAGRAPSGE